MDRPPASHEDILAVARIAGLDLEGKYLDEVIDAYRNIEPMLLRLRRGRPRADEPAHAFDPRKFLPRD
jgi:hypothetical protein